MAKQLNPCLSKLRIGGKVWNFTLLAYKSRRLTEVDELHWKNAIGKQTKIVRCTLGKVPKWALYVK